MSKTITARQILSTMDCAYASRQPALKLLSSPQALDKVMAPIARLGGHKLRQQMDVSFDRELLMQITMGQKSTGGYSLALATEKTIIRDGWADVVVQWNIPAEGMMLTQALTSPCLFIALPRQQYQGIRIVDQDGNVRIQTALQ